MKGRMAESVDQLSHPPVNSDFYQTQLPGFLEPGQKSIDGGMIPSRFIEGPYHFGKEYYRRFIKYENRGQYEKK